MKVVEYPGALKIYDYGSGQDKYIRKEDIISISTKVKNDVGYVYIETHKTSFGINSNECETINGSAVANAADLINKLVKVINYFAQMTQDKPVYYDYFNVTYDANDNPTKIEYYQFGTFTAPDTYVNGTKVFTKYITYVGGNPTEVFMDIEDLS